MEQRVQPAAATFTRSLNPPNPAENAATGTTTDTLVETSRSTTPEPKTGTPTTAQPGARSSSSRQVHASRLSPALDGRPFDIACCQIDIGNAASDMSQGLAAGTLQADGSVRPEPRMDVAEVGRAVTYMAGLPLSANVAAMTIMATKMPFVGRG